MEIPIPVIPSLGRHIYHGWVSLSAEHTILGTHLCPKYGDSYTRITILVPTYISQMGQSQCWAYNNQNTPMSKVWRFLHPNYCHWVDIYITDASVSMLNIQLLEHTYAPGMEIPIPELPSLCRHIYHRCVSLYAEHTIIEKQLCHRYGDSYTQITVIGSTYIYHGCISLYTEHAIIGTHLCPRYGDSYTRITAIGSTYISQMRQSLWWAYNY